VVNKVEPHSLVDVAIVEATLEEVNELVDLVIQIIGVLDLVSLRELAYVP
jgi:hypothetical protein